MITIAKMAVHLSGRICRSAPPLMPKGLKNPPELK
jgi:hypothetical protein